MLSMYVVREQNWPCFCMQVHVVRGRIHGEISARLLWDRKEGGNVLNTEYSVEDRKCIVKNDKEVINMVYLKYTSKYVCFMLHVCDNLADFHMHFVFLVQIILLFSIPQSPG